MIFTAIIEFILEENGTDLNLITYIPSREKHNALKIIATNLSERLNLNLIPSENLIRLENKC